VLRILIALVLISPCSALSEHIQGSGQISAWHDGLVKDRASGQGTFEYAWEGYAGGGSSGINLTDGKANYFFRSSDRSIWLREFSGLMVAESNEDGTTIDGNGTGKLESNSYEGRKGVLVSGMSTGEINALGRWNISFSSTRAKTVDPMETNATDGKPINTTMIRINASTEFPL
jgi:hypothetical protein